MFRSHVFSDQNKDGQINRKDMIRIIEAMYDLANEEDRTDEKSPDKRVDLIMQRLSKDKDGKSSMIRRRRSTFIRSTISFRRHSATGVHRWLPSR